MFGLGPVELIIILIIILLIFGPSKLPEVGRTLGQLIREVKKYSEEFEEQVKREFYDVSSQDENGKQGEE